MKQYAFGVDIGGTTVKIGLFSIEGSLLEQWNIPTRTEENGKNILPDIAVALKAKLQDKGIDLSRVAGVGMGVPGSVNDEGIVNKCVNLGWGVVDVAGEMKALIDLPVKVINDANCAALGEVYKGGGSRYKNIVMVTLGTGVGGGVIMNGQVVNGSCGGAGEIGHMPVCDDEPELCSCGKRGCLEQFCSANGIVRVTKRWLASNPQAKTCLRDVEKLTSKEICDGAKAGDPVALQMLDDMGRLLGKGLACVASTINPQAFVIGGGMSKAGEVLLEPVRRWFKHYAFFTCADVQFELAALENEAGIYGGLRIVQQSICGMQ